MRAVTTKPQPSQGRAFALESGQIRSAAKAAGLVDSDGRPILIRHLNPRGVDVDALRLLHLLPERELVVLSTPVDVPQGLVGRSLAAALPELAKHNSAPLWNRDEQVSYLAVLNVAESTVRIVRKVLRFQRRKYGPGSKFSNAFKRRKQSVDEAVLVTLPIRREE